MYQMGEGGGEEKFLIPGRIFFSEGDPLGRGGYEKNWSYGKTFSSHVTHNTHNHGVATA